MAIKAFHRTGLAKESRGSSLMKSCRTNKEAKCFRKGRGVPRCSSARNMAELGALGCGTVTRF